MLFDNVWAEEPARGSPPRRAELLRGRWQPTGGVRRDRHVSMVEAVCSALGDEMERDERVIVLGEDVGKSGGVFRATDGLQQRFGAERVVDTPVSEAAIVGRVDRPGHGRPGAGAPSCSSSASACRRSTRSATSWPAGATAPTAATTPR